MTHKHSNHFCFCVRFPQGAGIGFPGTHKGHNKGSFWNTCVLVGFLLAKPVVVPMFFCIAGYFAPPSLDKNGPFSFVRKHFKRLGFPFLVFSLVVNPLMFSTSYGLIQPTYNDTDASNWENTEWKSAKYEYFPISPHTWFLLWLLVFQCGYASLDGPPLLLDKIPSFGVMALGLLGTAGIQVLAAVCCIVGGSTLGFAEMPMTSPGDGFFNVRYSNKAEVLNIKYFITNHYMIGTPLPFTCSCSDSSRELQVRGTDGL